MWQIEFSCEELEVIHLEVFLFRSFSCSFLLLLNLLKDLSLHLALGSIRRVFISSTFSLVIYLLQSTFQFSDS